MDEGKNEASESSKSGYEPENPDHAIDNTIIYLFACVASFDESLERCFSPKESNDSPEHRGHSHIEPSLIWLCVDVVFDKDERRLTRNA